MDLLDAPRRRRVSVDPARLAELRDSAARRAGEEGAPRGPFDSGRGVRIQVRARCSLCTLPCPCRGLPVRTLSPSRRLRTPLFPPSSCAAPHFPAATVLPLLLLLGVAAPPLPPPASLLRMPLALRCVVQGGRVYDSKYGVTCHWWVGGRVGWGVQGKP